MAGAQAVEQGGRRPVSRGQVGQRAVEAAGPGDPPALAESIGGLKAAVDAAVAGRGCVVLVQYAADRLKSRVLETLLAHAEQRAVRVLRSRCEPRLPPLAPWSRLLPHEGREDASAANAAPPPRFELFAQIACVLEALARETPLVVLLDDLQHADRASLLLLESLARLLPAWRLAVVATYREPPRTSASAILQETLFELDRDSGCRRFALDAPGASICERAVFRPVADYRTIVFEGRVAHLRDSMGLRYLGLLLHRPGQPVHVTEIQATAGGTRRQKRSTPNTDAVERARLAVRKSLKSALARIDVALPALGRHLSATVRYGYFCTYTPDEGRPVVWEG